MERGESAPAGAQRERAIEEEPNGYVRRDTAEVIATIDEYFAQQQDDVIKHRRKASVDELPLARVKRIMKQDSCDPHPRMIGAESIPVMSFASQLFIGHITKLAWNLSTQKNGRNTLQLKDIKDAVSSTSTLDFLVDVLDENEDRNHPDDADHRTSPPVEPAPRATGKVSPPRHAASISNDAHWPLPPLPGAGPFMPASYPRAVADNWAHMPPSDYPGLRANPGAPSPVPDLHVGVGVAPLTFGIVHDRRTSYESDLSSEDTSDNSSREASFKESVFSKQHARPVHEGTWSPQVVPVASEINYVPQDILDALGVEDFDQDATILQALASKVDLSSDNPFSMLLDEDYDSAQSILGGRSYC